MRLLPSAPIQALLILLPVLLGGCADVGDDPFSSVLTEEGSGALDLQTDLPSPEGWAEGFGIQGLVGLSDWGASWKMEPVPGRASREVAYRVMVPVLSTYLDEEALAGGLTSLEEALNEAEEIPPEDIPDRIAIRLDLARDAQLRGALALEKGDSPKALMELLRGTDALREVEPRQVATQLLAAAVEGMRRLLSSEAYSEQTRERAQSLIRIARTAMRDADFTRAIQSAYYATQLLEVDVQ
jgi:hypothetical protein